MPSHPRPDIPFIVERTRFPAGPWRLEGELAYPEASTLSGAVVLAGPHPLLGGDLNNNVVRTLGDGLAGQGFAALRFNYHGVGGSEGPRLDTDRHLLEFWRTSQVANELDYRFDVAGAAAFLREVVGANMPLALAGYSFGCLLLAEVCAGQATPRVLIAPTLGKHDYRHYLSLKDPILAIAAEDDFAAPGEAVRSWFDALTAPRKELFHCPLDNHFFRGHEPWLVETVTTFLDAC
jgi:alpha/beta superfamily hydrolase